MYANGTIVATTSVTAPSFLGNATTATNLSTARTCAAGSSIRSLNVNGTVTCETDDSWITSESDPKVGTLTNTKRCTSDWSKINCTSAAPLTTESDPKVGTLSNTKRCTSDWTKVNCNTNAPLTSEVDWSTTNETPQEGNDIDVNGRTVSIEPTLDYVTKMNFSASTLTLVWSAALWQVIVGPNAGSEANSEIFLAEDNDGTYWFSIKYDWVGNKLYIWWKSTTTYYPSINIERNTGKTVFPDSVSATAFYYSSDITLKKDLAKISNPLDKIVALNGYYFIWKSDSTKDIGLIAQEVEKVFPDAVKADEKGLKSVKYGNLVAPIIEAIKELYNKYLDQQKKIDELEIRIHSLEKLLK